MPETSGHCLGFHQPYCKEHFLEKILEGAKISVRRDEPVWKVLSNAGLVSGEFSRIREDDWTVGFARGLERTLKKGKIALTNLCKETKPYGRNPGKDEIRRG